MAAKMLRAPSCSAFFLSACRTAFTGKTLTFQAFDSEKTRLYRLHCMDFASIIRHCGNTKDLEGGRRVQKDIDKYGYGKVRFLGNLLVEMYGRCGALSDAQAVFESIQEPNVFSWNLMLGVYVRLGSLDGAKMVFEKMPRRDVVSWNSMLAACAQQGDIQEARNIFHKMPLRDLVSWNSIIAACAQNGLENQALEFFRQMQLEGIVPDKVTYVSALDACAAMMDLVTGKKIHQNVVAMGLEGDLVVGNALINMYGKCESIEDAQLVFDKMPHRDVVTSTAMLAAYAYCGDVNNARQLFDEMHYRDVISWTTMLGAYVQNGNNKKALEFFHQMNGEGVKPDKYTYATALDACANQAALTDGKQIHKDIVLDRLDTDIVVANAIINMYGKCGRIQEAENMFYRLQHYDVVTWNAMLAVYAQNGLLSEALQLFQKMQVQSMTTANNIGIVSIISVCSHAGMVSEGCHYFISLSQNVGCSPTLEHLHCMVDLLGRAGSMDEAENFITHMGLEHISSSWMTLLGSCRIHADVKRAARIAGFVFILEPLNAAPYILLSNIYSAAGMWDNVAQIRNLFEDRIMKKTKLR